MERKVNEQEKENIKIPFWVTEGLSPDDAKKAENKYKKNVRLGYSKCKAFLIEYGQDPPEQMVEIMSDPGEKYKLKNIDSHLIPDKGYSMILWYNEYTDVADAQKVEGDAGK